MRKFWKRTVAAAACAALVVSCMVSPALAATDFTYRYIKHCHHLIKGVEAGVLTVILVIHDGARSPVNNIGQLLLCHPAGFPCPLDGEPYIVKIKPSFISFNLHNIT